jgi:phosphoribosylformimino-5-aminoimidazole carboxamide ribonucleotide (ProFAR) isomerase
MRALLSRHAFTIHLAGGIAFVGGVSALLWVTSLAGAIAGSALAATGLATMGLTHDRAGA